MLYKINHYTNKYMMHDRSPSLVLILSIMTETKSIGRWYVLILYIKYDYNILFVKLYSKSWVDASMAKQSANSV